MRNASKLAALGALLMAPLIGVGLVEMVKPEPEDARVFLLFIGGLGALICLAVSGVCRILE